jgi:hypothetical protein
MKNSSTFLKLFDLLKLAELPFALSLSKGILRGSTSAFSPELAEGSPRTGKNPSILKFNIVELRK